jgi:hypothetical protein
MALQRKRLSISGGISCLHKALVIQNVLNEYDCRLGTIRREGGGNG